ncbi:MAG: hypothetical protein PF503_21405 [Desulfobacula sp.]|jgi:hypothetical protein|nr:hypothetical protein [Desulfobacula sp.]
MRKIVSLIKKCIKRFFDHLSKESLKRNLTILDEIKKGGYV